MTTAAKSDWGNVDVLGRHHVSTLPRYWTVRLYIALSILTTLGVIRFEPNFLSHKYITHSGEFAWLCVGVLAVLSFIALVDVVVNDLLPETFQLRCAKSNRHLIYIFQALGIACIAFVLYAEGASIPVILSYLVDGAFAALVAFLDLFQRHRAPATT